MSYAYTSQQCYLVTDTSGWWLELEANSSDLIKGIYEKRTANTILTGERMDAFPIRLGTVWQCPFMILLLYTVQKVLASAIKQEKKKLNKRYPDQKEKSKTISLQMIEYLQKTLKNPK